MHVFIIAAVTLDGFIARETTEPALWSSKEDKQFFQARSKQAGLLVMGQTTFNTIGLPLPGRITIVYTNNPANILGSSDVTLLPLYPGIDLPTAVYTTNLPIPELINLLNEKMYPELAVCGGSSIYTQFMKSGLVNTLYLTQENISFGNGIPLFGEPLLPDVPATTITPLSPDTTLLEYQLQPNA